MPDIGDVDQVTDNFVQVCGKHSVFQRKIFVNILAVHAILLASILFTNWPPLLFIILSSVIIISGSGMWFS